MTSTITRFTLAAFFLAGVALCGAQSTSTVVSKSPTKAGIKVTASQELSRIRQAKVSKAAVNPTAVYQKNLDMNRDGAVNNLDVILARRASAGAANSPSN